MRAVRLRALHWPRTVTIKLYRHAKGSSMRTSRGWNALSIWSCAQWRGWEMGPEKSVASDNLLIGEAWNRLAVY